MKNDRYFSTAAMAGVFLLLLMVSFCEVLTIPLFDLLLSQDEGGAWARGLLAAAVFCGSYTVLRFLADYVEARVLAGIKRGTRTRFVSRYTWAEPQGASVIKIGELMKLYEACDSVGDRALATNKLAIAGIKILGVSVYLVVAVSWKLLVLILAIIACLSLLRFIGAPIQKRVEASMTADAKGGSFAKNAATNLRLIKQSMCREGILQRYGGILEEYAAAERSKELLITMLTVVQQASRAIVLVVVPLVVGVLMSSDGVQVQTLITADIAFLVLSDGVSQLVEQMGAFHQTGAMREMAKTVLDAPLWSRPQNQSPGEPAKWTLRVVSFAYEGKPVLSNVEMELPSQGILVLTGDNGAGKSTLLDVISGLKDEGEGEILLGSRPCDRNSRLEAVAYQPQQSYLFAGTVRENIAYAKAGEGEDMESFFQNLGLSPVVEKLPEGLDTAVAPGGENLSGGQRQLVCFLRTVYKDAGLVILDEPLSSMNQETAGEIVSALSILAKRAAVVIVSHQGLGQQLGAKVINLSQTGREEM